MASVKDFVESARRKLVDTTMRNRLLNYATGKRSAAVEIVGEQPAAIWEAVVVQGKRLQFRGTAPKNKEADSTAPSAIDDGGDGQELPPAEFFSDLASIFDPQHVDEFLDTKVPSDVLDTRIRRLSDTARASLEEQGVATLFLALGFLHFFEDESSEKERKAPLLLVPTTLARTKGDKWAVRMSEDDPLVNPALVEYLQAQHRLQLQEIPDEGFKPAEWFSAVKAVVAVNKRWRVSAACLLGNFSFQKFVMHEDLKKNAVAVAAHPIIDLLARRTGDSPSLSTLPPGIQNKDLDTAFSPETTFQVVDADSTQQRALAAVATGKNLVIQGPPGTGKSQTITNLISGALAEGKTVLFVAEKQAALNVVYDRLRKAGLGDFCLELHSSKANKKVLLGELKRAWDASSVATTPEPKPQAELATVRKVLTAYTKAVHSPIPPLDLSPFAVMGRLLQLEGIVNVRVPIKTAGITKSGVEETGRTLAELSGSVARLGCAPSEHAWSGAALQHLSLERREALFDALDRIGPLLRSMLQDARGVETQFGLRLPTLSTAAETLTELANVLSKAPGIPAAITNDLDWNGASMRALQIIDRGRNLTAQEDRTRGTLTPVVRAEDLQDAVAIVMARGRSIWAWFSGAWRSARRRLKAAVPAAAWQGAFNAAERIAELLKAKAERGALNANAESARFFGRGWRGADSDWTALKGWVAWGHAFRETATRLALSPAAFGYAETSAPNVDPLRQLASKTTEARALWKTIRDAGGWPADYLAGATVAQVSDRLDLLDRGRDGWREMATFQVAVAKARATAAQPLVEAALSRELEWGTLSPAFERRFLTVWLDEVEAKEPVLGRFDGGDHATKIAAFRLLDKQALEINKERTSTRLRQRTQEQLRHAVEETKFLRDQMARMRGHKPVRQLVQRAHRAVQAIKPCFLMSPMTVAQTLDPKYPFDIVIFDEASQLTCEDALGAIVRGKQLVVVGDPKQLPPTNFFSVQLGEIEVPEGDDGEQAFQDLESILELAQAAGFHGAQLRWHYRSRHESLIAYSNQNFYDSSLLTFPSVDRAVGHFGLSFEHVADAKYEGKGTNTKEAERVVAAVLRHAQEHPTRSLCVGTFSLPQQLRIQDLLERERRTNPALEAFLALDKPEPFFVKNLESIQGDERDVVFLSVTYGRGVDGKIRYNFGPLNGQSGWRRLNVLTTRAREQMRVFSSMRADDMTVGDQMRGAVLLRDFLKYAETGVLAAGPMVTAMAETESPFEQEVLSALSARGVQLVPQVGVAGYRIDFGVTDSEVPGRFVCGIECDGVAYHSAESARDRDRLREEVLRGLGWELHRLWSTDWWHDRKRQTERLLSLIEASRQKAKRAKASPPEGANAARAAGTVTSDAGIPPPAQLSVTPRRMLTIPVFEPYRTATLPRQRGDLVDATTPTIAGLCRGVLEVEGPVHDEVLRDRLMDAFGHRRAGGKIVERLDRALLTFQGAPGVDHFDVWWRLTERAVVPRSRRDVASSADLIAPREYGAAVIAALVANSTLNDEELVTVLRDGFGFGSATARFRTEVASATAALVAENKLVHASGGYAQKSRSSA